MKKVKKKLKITVEINIEGEEGVNVKAQVYRLIGKMVKMFDRQGFTVPPDARDMFELEVK